MIFSFDLSGTWGFRADRDKKGINVDFSDLPYNDTIELPSTVSLSRKTERSTERKTYCLTDEYPFEGCCLYYRDIDIGLLPEGAKAELFLERTRQTKLWVNGEFIGERNSLCTPHIYDITDYISEGSAKVCLMVSNTDYPTKGGHMTSEDTQTNWNGITGEISVRISDRKGISAVRAYPDTASHSVKLVFDLTGIDEAEVSIWGASSDCRIVDNVTRHITAEEPCTVIDLGEDVSLWDEYSPVIYTLKAVINGSMDVHTVCFGMRDFRAENRHFTVNGRTVFLRGKHDAMLFPLTGAAPTSVEEWYEVFRRAKEWGINHYRFHTCCPPEAAFTAADMIGMYLQPELPFWGTVHTPDEEGFNGEEPEYLLAEGRRILDTYGGHPSFVMMSLGNELWGDTDFMNRAIAQFRAMDSRHLYTQGSNNFQFCPKVLDEDDFFSGVRLGRTRLLRGSYAQCDVPLGFIQTESPNTAYSYDRNIAAVSDESSRETDITVQREQGTVSVKADTEDMAVPDIPIISHEAGQYYSFPDISAVEKFTGSLKAHYLDIYRERLREKGMEALADDMHRASGMLAFQCYKLETEAAMRSELLSGLQLLDLQDFTGQGVASVGMLDAFMDEKSFVKENDLRHKWSGFCSDAVILAEIESFVLEEGQQVTLPVYLRYMRPDALTEKNLTWNIGGAGGELDIPDGMTGLAKIGDITFKAIGTGERALSLSIEGITANSYCFWVYPAADGEFTIPEVSERGDSRVHITHAPERAVKLLDKGERVILFHEKPRESIRGFYCTDFWNYSMFRNISESMGREEPVGTLGLLIDKDHPALRRFHCERYSTPQWYHIVTHSECAVLDGTPLRPIVQVIDNPERVHRLGLLYEAQIGRGKLLVCTCRIREIIHRPEVQQFLRSLTDYAHSDSFAPSVILTTEELHL